MKNNNRQPIINPVIQDYLKDTLLDNITQQGSYSCKILFPAIFAKNIQTLTYELDIQMIDYKIYFANKATKSDVFLSTALQSGIWIDVSSEQELYDAINVWYNTQNIIANGPKSIWFLKLCLEHNVMISVDSIAEVQKIVDLQMDSQSKIMIRIYPPYDINHSRFGIREMDMIAHQSLIVKLHEIYSIYGLNFHIDSINIQDKQHMIRHIIGVRESLLERGIHIEQLWIGWWFGLQYVDGILHNQPAKEYPQNKRTYGIESVHALLATDIEPGLSFVQYLRESMTILHIEPGRLLLDQCGICIHHIIDKKYNKIFIDGNMYSLGSIGQEMPQDPLIYRDWQELLSQEYKEYEIYGNLCMEFDKIYTRTISLPNNIEIGDMLIFINTATYFSDFSDSQPIKHNERQEIIIR